MYMTPTIARVSPFSPAPEASCGSIFASTGSDSYNSHRTPESPCRQRKSGCHRASAKTDPYFLGCLHALARRSEFLWSSITPLRWASGSGCPAWNPCTYGRCLRSWPARLAVKWVSTRFFAAARESDSLRSCGMIPTQKKKKGSEPFRL